MPAAKAPTNRSPSTQTPRRWFEVTNQAGQTPEIRFIGIIGLPAESYDWWSGRTVENENAAGSFEEFLSELDAVGDVPELIINICSPGGDYSTGMAIHDRLARHPANKTCIIDGECSSAATYIALACQTVRMPANARMMFHRAEGCCWGNADAIQQYLDMLAWIDGNIADLYAQRCGKSADEMLAMMTDETQLNGTQAVALGLADEVLAGVSRKPVNPPANFRAMNFAVPAAARALFDKARQTTTPANSAIKPMTPTPATPAPAPAPEPVAPTNNAPQPAPAAAQPAPAPEPAAPVNNAPQPAPAAQPDIASIVTAAVTNAVKPLQDRLAVIEGQRAAGIDPANLGGAPAPAPVANGGTSEAPKKQVSNLGMASAAWKAKK